jgi:capsular polysaccharide export protein
MRQRHFLFLQGLPGPSFRLMGEALARHGQRVSHLAFNGGDLANRRGKATLFRGWADGFGPWLDDHVSRQEVTDLVLFGEHRPLHRTAIDAARRLGLDVHVLEEGYLRPNSVTLESWPAGEAWRWPESLADCASRAQPEGPEAPVPGHFRRRLYESISYWLWSVMLTPLFPRYRSHRPTHAFFEMLQWIARTPRRPFEQAHSRTVLQRLEGKEFFLFPLQIDGDAQLTHRSPFIDMADAMEAVIASFARAAPEHSRLLVKRHPFDPDPKHWDRLVAAAASRHGVPGRVDYVAFADLDRLLKDCRGVITVNSTVGSLALRAGTPAHALGDALYAMEGLASQGDPDPFWTAPRPVAEGAYEAFSRALFGEVLVNAGLHSRQGLAMLAEGAARRMIGSRR